ncbi:diacylglycerol/lipid kinase family protein [Syntrophomonas palmitatica]|uniref:diacylglycerol/lipid kinase family protein n=1 Tax=Syntrophomonas palmitatica TaxID=402877 RepID=UPI0006D1918F|nr:diacylglycerol kinase family protein [Syntrophomonas palmitatica]
MNKLKTVFVVNPVSNNGRTRKKWQKIAAALQSRGYDFQYIFTSAPLDAVDITRMALREGCELVIAVGGDGTINEVVNGFYLQGELINPNACLSAVPMGTGGDLTRVLHFPRHLDGICNLLDNPEIITCDLAHAQFHNWQGEPCERYFLNVADIGFGADVCVRVNRNSKALGGFLSFLLSVVGAIAGFQNRNLSISVDGISIYCGASVLSVVGNGRYFGGGMMIAPHAEYNDGLLDVVILKDFKKAELLYNLPLVYKGTHLKHPKISIARGREVKIHSEYAACLEIDGETPGLSDAAFNVIPGGIKIAKNKISSLRSKRHHLRLPC